MYVFVHATGDTSPGFLDGKILKRLGQGDSGEIELLWFAAACVTSRFLRFNRRNTQPVSVFWYPPDGTPEPSITTSKALQRP